jgi:dihydrofolate reductase
MENLRTSCDITMVGDVQCPVTVGGVCHVSSFNKTVLASHANIMMVGGYNIFKDLHDVIDDIIEVVYCGICMHGTLFIPPVNRKDFMMVSSVSFVSRDGNPYRLNHHVRKV